MRINDMDRQLEFQAPTKVSDGMGGFVNTFKTMFTVWGSLWELQGEEKAAAMQMGGIMTGRVRIRYKPITIRTSWRIKNGNTYLNIASPPINVSGKKKWLEIKVKEAA